MYFCLHFSYDFLKVYDGPSMFDIEIESLTGLHAETVTSTGPDLFLNFVSDSSETTVGFSCRYDAGKIRLHFMIQ